MKVIKETGVPRGNPRRESQSEEFPENKRCGRGGETFSCGWVNSRPLVRAASHTFKIYFRSRYRARDRLRHAFTSCAFTGPMRYLRVTACHLSQGHVGLQFPQICSTALVVGGGGGDPRKVLRITANTSPEGGRLSRSNTSYGTSVYKLREVVTRESAILSVAASWVWQRGRTRSIAVSDNTVGAKTVIPRARPLRRGLTRRPNLHRNGNEDGFDLSATCAILARREGDGINSALRARDGTASLLQLKAGRGEFVSGRRDSVPNASHAHRLVQGRAHLVPSGMLRPQGNLSPFVCCPVPSSFRRTHGRPIGAYISRFPIHATKAKRVRFWAGSLPILRTWELRWTMPLVGGFSLRSPVSHPTCDPALLHIHLSSHSSTLKTTMLRPGILNPNEHTAFIVDNQLSKWGLCQRGWCTIRTPNDSGPLVDGVTSRVSHVGNVTGMPFAPQVFLWVLPFTTFAALHHCFDLSSHSTSSQGDGGYLQIPPQNPDTPLMLHFIHSKMSLEINIASDGALVANTQCSKGPKREAGKAGLVTISREDYITTQTHTNVVVWLERSEPDGLCSRRIAWLCGHHCDATCACADAHTPHAPWGICGARTALAGVSKDHSSPFECRWRSLRRLPLTSASRQVAGTSTLDRGMAPGVRGWGSVNWRCHKMCERKPITVISNGLFDVGSEVIRDACAQGRGIGKEIGRNRPLVWVPSQHSPGVISENHGKPKSGWPDRESNSVCLTFDR
ncbi:hypothetical protein PR048_007869 [Dryococelus australis]|uniref:Uncharacterized protein n=1 Tax=Dryococelus australis TaxID=614101 RepID=A0ABQ9HVG5_9NEOP|nr:hypothetical protein PR048_007869 [Dryococelus australis]